MSKKKPAAKADGFYAPVAGGDELHRLASKWRRDRVVFFRLLWAVAAVAVLLVALNLTGTTFDSTLSRSLRAWSLFPVLSLALLLTPLAVRDFWLRRRVLVAQRRLLGHRGLLGRESEIRAAESRIREELSALSPADPRAEAALATATSESEQLLDELSRIGLERLRDPEMQAQQDLSELRLLALLDAYAQAIETMGLEAALEPAFYSSGAATEALERSRRLLAP